MSLYTMQIKDLINNPLTPIFNFDYPFYSDNEDLKKEFEELFIMKFYFHEIGAETFARWQQMLKARLYLRMPYYRQLYQTEWTQVNKDMMNSKDLTETTTHTLTSHQLGTQEQQGLNTSSSHSEGNGTETSEASSQSTGSGTETSEASSQSTGSGEGTNNSTELESALENGVPQVHLETDLTRKTQTNSTSSTSSEASSESESTSTSSTEASSESESNSKSSTQTNSSNHATNESSMTNQQQNQLEEKTTFTSKGDIGVQTPAYAITEWRKVIINLNEMILEDLSDLFMLIY